jgi:hypothetical protein
MKFNTKGWKAPEAFRCNRNNVFFRFMFSWVMVNNEASNTHVQPTTSFSVLGPRTEHWPRAPRIFKTLLSKTHTYSNYQSNQRSRNVQE